MAGDGSGGPDSRDYRTRRCGFGIAILSLGTNPEDCRLLGHARGTVPGKQTVPRAEAMALLHVLTYTVGHCTYVCDNLGVCNRFWGLSKAGYNSKDNGLLWYHIGLALERRVASGHGSLEVVWMPSHISFEEAINRGYSAAHWVANQCADKLAGEAAKEAALSGTEAAEFRDRDKLVSLILGRLVDVVFHIAPDNVSIGCILSKEHTKPKAELVGLWAREAGHSLDGKFRCVKCGLSINMNKNAEYLKLVLHMECMGGAGLKPHLALHNKPKDRNDLDHIKGQFYLFQGLRVHDSHPMASNMALGFHFCTFCGAFGTERSKNLHGVCPSVPTNFRRQALARIAKGLRPNLPPKGLGEEGLG